jgi:choice-of-anchor C domain-containing protein
MGIDYRNVVRQGCVLAGLMIAGVGSASAAPFTNGSFELATVNPGGGWNTLAAGNPAIAGWEIYGANADYIGTYWQAAEGTHSVDLNGTQGAAGIRQTFDTVAGREYLVRFALSGNPDGAPTFKVLNVSTDGYSGNYAFSVANTSRADMQWFYFSFLFTAASNSSTLSFLSLTSGNHFGPALDDVSVSVAAVPEPATLSLVAFGLAAVARGRFKKRLA